MKLRIYGQWAGNPSGRPEDVKRCIVELYSGKFISRQCYRKRGHGPDGLYCKQHAKEIERHPGRIDKIAGRV